MKSTLNTKAQKGRQFKQVDLSSLHRVQGPINFGHSTANAALATSLARSATLPQYSPNTWKHGRITSANASESTANDSLFSQAHFSEPMTNYAVGWTDEEEYDALVEFLAPAFQAPGDYFEYAQFDNSEEFLSDGTYDDLRAIDADFKTADYTSSKVFNKLNNRGLRIELDWDRIKTDPMWQQRYTGKLLRRLKRNQARRAAALGIASGTSDPLVFSGSSQPDILLNAAVISAGDSSGIKPNRLLYGLNAWQLRLAAYGGQNNAGAYAGLARDIDGVGAWLKLQAMLDTGRYQNGASKTQIIGSNILVFTGQAGVDADDPTNFKLAWTPCANGTRYAVYVRQISVKKWEIVVEHYELLIAATVLGCYVMPITSS